MEKSIKRCDIQCNNCGEIEKIQISIYADSGYSDWTVEDTGQFELKCHGCGKFGTTDEYAKTNEMDNFTVRCHDCMSTQWIFAAGNVDGDFNSELTCKKCKIVLLADENKH